MPDDSALQSDSGDAGRASEHAYWRTNIRYVLILLAIWFTVSFGAGILFKDALDSVRIGGAGLGFWFAQQGAVFIFVVLIAIYVRLMLKLDRRYGVQED